MDKIIIKNHRKELPDIEILRFISEAVKKGKISENKGRQQYCHAVRFSIPEVMVHCDLTKTGTTVFTIL